MCGRFFRENVSWAEYYAVLNILGDPPERVEPPEAMYNGAPTQIHPVVRLNEVARAREMVLCNAGWCRPGGRSRYQRRSS